jgi:hypothetical protein
MAVNEIDVSQTLFNQLNNPINEEVEKNQEFKVLTKSIIDTFGENQKKLEKAQRNFGSQTFVLKVVFENSKLKTLLKDLSDKTSVAKDELELTHAKLADNEELSVEEKTEDMKEVLLKHWEGIKILLPMLLPQISFFEPQPEEEKKDDLQENGDLLLNFQGMLDDALLSFNKSLDDSDVSQKVKTLSKEVLGEESLVEEIKVDEDLPEEVLLDEDLSQEVLVDEDLSEEDFLEEDLFEDDEELEEISTKNIDDDFLDIEEDQEELELLDELVSETDTLIEDPVKAALETEEVSEES